MSLKYLLFVRNLRCRVQYLIDVIDGLINQFSKIFCFIAGGRLHEIAQVLVRLC